MILGGIPTVLDTDYNRGYTNSSLIRIVIGGTTVPISDCLDKGEHPTPWPYYYQGSCPVLFGLHAWELRELAASAPPGPRADLSWFGRILELLRTVLTSRCTYNHIRALKGLRSGL